MKTLTRTSVALLVIAGTWAALWFRTDTRLVGIYTPDVEDTHALWEPSLKISLEDVRNAFDQMFNSEPMVLTDRRMILSTPTNTLTERYVVLWKSHHQSVIALSLRQVYQVQFTDDGAWFIQKKILGHPTHPITIKMNKAELQPGAGGYGSPEAGKPPPQL